MYAANCACVCEADVVMREVGGTEDQTLLVVLHFRSYAAQPAHVLYEGPSNAVMTRR
jgi:hypothetical protein